MTAVLVFAHVLLALVLVVLVLMHSGKDAGMSGLGMSPEHGATRVMERNLSRATVVVALLLVATTVTLGFRI